MTTTYDLGKVTGGVIIFGFFATLTALQNTITNPAPGDAYGIGAGAPYDIYI